MNLLLPDQDVSSQLFAEIKKLNEEIRCLKENVKAGIQEEKIEKNQEKNDIMRQIERLNTEVKSIRTKMTGLHSRRTLLQDKGKSIAENKETIEIKKKDLTQLSRDHDVKKNLWKQKKLELEGAATAKHQEKMASKIELEKTRDTLDLELKEKSKMVRNLKSFIDTEANKKNQRMKKLQELEK